MAAFYRDASLSLGEVLEECRKHIQSSSFLVFLGRSDFGIYPIYDYLDTLTQGITHRGVNGCFKIHISRILSQTKTRFLG